MRGRFARSGHEGPTTYGPHENTAGQVQARIDSVNVGRYRTFCHMDKRESVRVPVRVKARCRCQGVVIDGFVEDLSRSGMFLRAPEMIASGSSAEIDLDVPGEEPLRLEAEVVRIEHTDEREGMAFRFVDPAANGRGLANIIMRQHATSTR